MWIDSEIAVVHDGLEESARIEILTWLSKIEYEQLHYNARESKLKNWDNSCLNTKTTVHG